MTKSLKTVIAKPEAPRPASSRLRAVLVALLGFGAADLLVLNLWAVPKLVTTVTTTDVRAAQSTAARAAPAASPRPNPDTPKKPREPAAPTQAQPEVAVAPAQAQPEVAAQPEEAAARAQAQPEQAAAEQTPRAAVPVQVQAQVAEADATGAKPEPAPELAIHTSGAPPQAAPPADEVEALRAAQLAGLQVEGQPLAHVYFSQGNFALGPRGKAALEHALPLLTADEQQIMVVGSADPTGPEVVNERLSDARAQSVADWLVGHGIAEARVQTHGIGNNGATGNWLDRRVDIWLGGSR